MEKRAARQQRIQRELIAKKKLYKSKKNWVIAGTFLVAGALALTTQTNSVSASTGATGTRIAAWAPNSVANIKSRIANGQTSLTMISGDTVYNIGLAINLKNPMQLLYDNGYQNGEQYTLPVGTVIRWDGNHVTVADAKGNIIGDKVVQDSQKVDPTAPIANQTSDQQANPVASDANGNVISTNAGRTTSKPATNRKTSATGANTNTTANATEKTTAGSQTTLATPGTTATETGNTKPSNSSDHSTTQPEFAQGQIVVRFVTEDANGKQKELELTTNTGDTGATLDFADLLPAGYTAVGNTKFVVQGGKGQLETVVVKKADTDANTNSENPSTQPEFAQGQIVVRFVTEDANGKQTELELTTNTGDTGSTLDFADLLPAGYTAVGNTKFVVQGGKGQLETVVVKNTATATTPIDTPAKTVDKTALNAEIAKASALKSSDYTLTSFSNLINAIASAKLVAKGATATQIAVDAQTTALTKAVSALEKVLPAKVDKSTLHLAIATASPLTADKYTKASFDRLNQALANGISIYADAKATQGQVDAAATALNQALANLVVVPVGKTYDVIVAYHMGGGGELAHEVYKAKAGEEFTFTATRTFPGYHLVGDKTQSFRVIDDGEIVFYYNKNVDSNTTN